jgi:glycosyltransferase involved in cell wall biosynthesis
MNPSVSVLMTAYNRENYVREAIQSVLNSTLTDFELIVVDDGSTDHTVDIVNQLVKLDSRIRFYQNEQNLGDYPNRNKVATFATGKYLKYVDADDFIYPWGLQILYDCMEQFPEAGWGLCSLDPDKSRPFPFQLNPNQAYRYHYLGPGLFHKAPLSCIIRRDCFQEVGGFKPNRMVGDFEMWHRLALKYPVVLMNHGIVWYRIHADQESASIGKYEKSYAAIRQSYLTHPACPLSEEERSLVTANLKRINGKNRLIRFVKNLYS